MNNTNNYSARQSYDIAKTVLYNSWIDNFSDKNPGNFAKAQADCETWVNNRKLSQSEIRLETGLNTANSTFTFGVTPTQQNSSGILYKTEQRLNLQDSLIVSEYGIYIAHPASDADIAFQLRTYPNPVDFPTGATALEGLYSNGYFLVKVNNDIIVPYRGLFNHLYRGQTQQTAALGAGSPDDQIRGAEDGQITQEPNMLLIGSKNYIPQIILPGNLAAVDANARIVVIFRGILAQNSTVIN